jgi:hypothetical protein
MQIIHAKSVTIADATGTATGWFGTSTVTVPATDLQRPSDWNSVHNLGLTLAGGNTKQNSTWTGTNLSFSGAGPVSLGLSGNTLVISAPTLNFYRPFELRNNTSYSTLENNRAYLQHFIPDAHVVFSNVELWIRGSFSSSTNSHSVAFSLDYGLYSRDGTGASSTRMTLMASSRILMSSSYNSNTAFGFTISQPGSTSYTVSSGGTGLAVSLSGANHIYLPFTGSMFANNKYALGLRVSTAGSTQAGQIQFLQMSMMNSRTMGRILPTTFSSGNVSVIGDFEMGTHGTTSSSLHVSYATSQLGIALSRMVQYVQFED